MPTKKPMGTMSPEDIFEVAQAVTSQLRTLTERGVQTMFLANTVSINVEFSVFSEKKNHLMTTSIVLFPNDKEKKFSFLKGYLYTLTHTTQDVYDIVGEIDKRYKSEFTF